MCYTEIIDYRPCGCKEMGPTTYCALCDTGLPCRLVMTTHHRYTPCHRHSSAPNQVEAEPAEAGPVETAPSDVVSSEAETEIAPSKVASSEATAERAGEEAVAEEGGEVAETASSEAETVQLGEEAEAEAGGEEETGEVSEEQPAEDARRAYMIAETLEDAERTRAAFAADERGRGRNEAWGCRAMKDRRK